MLALNKETIRESVWLEAWIASRNQTLNPSNSADECLMNFDQQFPEHKERKKGRQKKEGERWR